MLEAGEWCSNGKDKGRSRSRDENGHKQFKCSDEPNNINTGGCKARN